MFKDRAIQISMAKPSTDAKSSVEEDFITTERIVFIGAAFERVTKKIAFGVAGYVILDTFRKVMIIKAKKAS